MVIVLDINIRGGKVEAVIMHNVGYEDWVVQDDLLIYTDTSKADGGTGMAYVVFEWGMAVKRWGCRTPSHWDVLECELFAILDVIRRWAGRWRHHVRILTDSRTSLVMLGKADREGEMAAVWEAFCLMFNKFRSVSLY